MDEEEIYICFPGEIVVYKPRIAQDQNAGLLCVVHGIKKGKVELTVCPGTSNILALPEDIIESGDYGSDMYDTKDELYQLYEGFDDSEEMDTGEQAVENSTGCHEPAPDVALGTSMETFMYHHLCRNHVQAFDALSIVSDTHSNTVQKQLYFGKCVQGLGDNERALNYYMRAFNQSGGAEAYIMCHVALCFHDMNSNKEAWDWCQRALQASPHSPQARYLAARLLSLNPDDGTKDCIEQLRICIMHCPVIDAEQLPSEAVEMWCEIAKLAQSLRLDASLCVRAWLRAIGVARSVGALSPLTAQSSLSPKRTAELARIRPTACTALFELGNALFSSLIAPEPSPPTDAWRTVSKNQNSSSLKKNKVTGASAGAKGAAPLVPVGWGYVQGAYAAHHWCNQISGGSNPEHRKALSETQAVLNSISK